ncbi:unnamed protein product [Moneuplotes crassus]|uniref:Uncharacterized protein n=1 Tax=Euplotes crassus TaxID=5936 RepID=A0AAD1XGB2_EUPCR|nr:unnamed protein product [Moneuplotes crassus]
MIFVCQFFKTNLFKSFTGVLFLIISCMSLISLSILKSISKSCIVSVSRIHSFTFSYNLSSSDLSCILSKYLSVIFLASWFSSDFSATREPSITSRSDSSCGSSCLAVKLYLIIKLQYFCKTLLPLICLLSLRIDLRK